LRVGAIPRAEIPKLNYQLFHYPNYVIGRTTARHRRVKDGAPFKRWSDEWADLAI
jgi:hypothetical protein